jgi:hypothetical protein
LAWTYPPAAALLFAPLAALPAQLAWAVMASASVLALALVIRVTVTAVPCWRFPAGWSTLLLTMTMLCLLPVWRTIGLSQVTMVLMAMVTVDVLVVSVGPAQLPDNQSLNGLIARLTDMAAWSAPAAWAIGAVLAVPVLMLMLRYQRRGQDVAALCVTACYGLLLAPISWRPTWVWIAPVLVALLYWLQLTWHDAKRHGGRWPRWAGSCAVIAVFTSTYSVPISQQRHRMLGPFWFFVLSNPYLLTTIAVALVLGRSTMARWQAGRLVRRKSASGVPGG